MRWKSNQYLNTYQSILFYRIWKKEFQVRNWKESSLAAEERDV